MGNRRVVWLIALAIVAGCNGASNAPGNTALSGGSGSTGSTVTDPSVGGTGSAGTGAPGARSPAAGAGAPSPSAAGSSANNGAGGMASNPMQPVDPSQPPVDPTTGQPTLAMGECVASGLHTKWMGDEYCINPPPADKGFQIHIGPSNYDNPEPKYLMQPGTETNETFNVTSGNTSNIYYYFRQYRMRPGSHHLIVSTGGIGGRRLGGTTNRAKDNPTGGVIAPENQGVGMPLNANTPLTISLHYNNVYSVPIIKEAWVNFWYRDASVVKEASNEIFSTAPINIAPGQHVLLSGSCPISKAGRLLTLYGHRHANNLRFAAWRTRGSQRDLVLDDYTWDNPLVVEYSSLVQNPAPDPSAKAQGGWSGILDMQPGDKLDFSCEIANMTNMTFVGQNEAINDEMCILVGDAVGTTVPAFCTYSTQQL
jgi:hypothetical protein